MGASSCGEWIKDRADNSVENKILWSFKELWLLGYLSGIAVSKNQNLLNGIDAASIELWMDNYCNSHPLDDIGDGGDALAIELKKKMNHK